MAKVFFKYFPDAIRKLFNNAGSTGVRQMRTKAVKVQALARKNLLRPPGGFDTGALSASIKIKQVNIDGAIAFQVGSELPYARFVHDGTGIYGPKGQMIKPKHAKVLRWQGPGGEAIFARQVKGMKPNPFLRDALSALRD